MFSAHQTVENRVDDQRTDLEAELPVERLSGDQAEAGRVGQTAQKFRVGHLLSLFDANLDDRSQEPGKGRSEVSCEPFMERLKRAHLVLADSLGTLEVVGADFNRFVLPAMPRKDLPWIEDLVSGLIGVKYVGTGQRI